MNSVTITCSRCGRSRRVHADSMPAQMKNATTWNGKRWRRCITCKMLASVEQHYAAIDKLKTKIARRRMAGL